MNRQTVRQLFLPLLICLLLLAFVSDASAKTKRKTKKKAPEKQAATVQQQQEDEIGAYRRKRVEVIQDRQFHRKGKFEVSLSAGLFPDNSWYFYTGLEFRGTYHFTEYLGIEADFFYIFNSEKDLVQAIQDAFGQRPVVDILEMYYGADFVFTPLYGKFAFLTRHILHWDFFIPIGVGAFKTDRTTRFAGNFGVGMHVIFNRWVAFRFDFRNYTYRQFIELTTGTGTGNVVNTQDYSFGVSVYLPPL